MFVGHLDVTLAIRIKCGAVRMTGSPVASTEVDGNGESPDAVAATVNGPLLLPTDGKVAPGI